MAALLRRVQPLMEQCTFQRLQEWFSGYSRSFVDDPEESAACALKEVHSRNVCDIMGRLADAAGLAAGEATLAVAVALLHDVGRFEQYRHYRTFRDSESINHALLGLQILRREGVLDGLPPLERRTITAAIGLHNVFKVPDGLPEHLLRYVQLIRDADKLDIWRVFIEFYTDT